MTTLKHLYILVITQRNVAELDAAPLIIYCQWMVTQRRIGSKRGR